MSCFRDDLKNLCISSVVGIRLGNLHGKVGKRGEKASEVSWLVRLRNRLVRDHAGLGKIVQLTVGYRILSHSG
jgi:hypothetical protein